MLTFLWTKVEIPWRRNCIFRVCISRRKWSRNNTKSFKSPSHHQNLEPQNPEPRRINGKSLNREIHSQIRKITLSLSLIHSLTQSLLLLIPCLFNFYIFDGIYSWRLYEDFSINQHTPFSQFQCISIFISFINYSFCQSFSST